MADFLDIKSNALAIEMKVSSALKQRRIFLSDEITRESLFEVSYLLYKLEDLDKKTGNKEPIEIIINSFGGYCLDGNMLISQIEQMKDNGYEIITTISGYAMSMSFLIALVGSKRKAYRHARLMTHQPSSGTFGTLQEMEEDIEETNHLWEEHKVIITKYSKITDTQLEEHKKMKKDWYMNPIQAKELNVIDIIL